MSDVTNRRVEHIFRKYPELLTSLCDIRSYEMINSKSCNSTLRRVLRKDSERFRRLKRVRKSPYSKLNQFGKVFFDILDRDKELFTCPICRSVLDIPVTIECGHTFCAECLSKANTEKCCCCLADVQPPRRIDVLIKDLVGKWREIRDNKFGKQSGIYFFYKRKCVRASKCKSFDFIRRRFLMSHTRKKCYITAISALRSRNLRKKCFPNTDYARITQRFAKYRALLLRGRVT